MSHGCPLRLDDLGAGEMVVDAALFRTEEEERVDEEVERHLSKRHVQDGAHAENTEPRRVDESQSNPFGTLTARIALAGRA